MISSGTGWLLFTVLAWPQTSLTESERAWATPTGPLPRISRCEQSEVSGDDIPVQAVVTDHWNGDYLYESSNRPDDGATIHAITTFARGVGFYTPDSEEAASTIQ